MNLCRRPLSTRLSFFLVISALHSTAQATYLGALVHDQEEPFLLCLLSSLLLTRWGFLG